MDSKNASFEDEIKNMSLEEKAHLIEHTLGETSLNWAQILRLVQAIGCGFATIALTSDHLLNALIKKGIITIGEANATRNIDNELLTKSTEEFLEAFTHTLIGGDKQ